MNWGADVVWSQNGDNEGRRIRMGEKTRGWDSWEKEMVLPEYGQRMVMASLLRSRMEMC